MLSRVRGAWADDALVAHLLVAGIKHKARHRLVALALGKGGEHLVEALVDHEMVDAETPWPPRFRSGQPSPYLPENKTPSYGRKWCKDELSRSVCLW